jgi:hypothetical protein
MWEIGTTQALIGEVVTVEFAQIVHIRASTVLFFIENGLAVFQAGLEPWKT